MADSFIRLPADSTGKQLDTTIVNMGVGTTEVHREKVVLADPTSTSGFGTVTSSQGLQVSSTQAQTISGTVTVLSASSGLVQISGTPTVLSGSSGFALGGIYTSSGALVVESSNTAVRVTNVTVVSVQGFSTGLEVRTVSASSGFVQAWPAVTPTSSVAGASLGPVTSSAGVLGSLSSGTISLSSQITVTAQQGTPTNWAMVSASSGLVQVSGIPTVISASSANPTPIVVASSSLNFPVVNASSGLIQVSAIAVSPTSSVAGAGLVVITSSGGLSVSIVAGAVGSTAVNIMGTQGVIVVTVTSGSFASGLYVFSTAGGGAGSTAVNLPTVSASGFASVTSSAGLVTNISSGTVSLSSQITVTATGPVTVTSGTVTLSSVPTVFSASSGGIQSFFPITPTSSVAGAGFGPVTSSAGVLVSLSSGTVSLSSQITVTATGPVSVTSGLISITSGTITSTAGTNPWSSAPGFNLPVVSVSSGLVQISGTVTVLNASSGLVQISGVPTVLSASSGFIQAWPAVTPTSSIAGANLGPVTSSAGILASLTSGTVSLSSQISVTSTAATNPWSSAPGFNIPVISVSSGLIQLSSQITVTATGPVTITSGIVTLSSAPLVIVASSGGTQTVILSSQHTVTAVAASSGITQILSMPTVSTSGLRSFSAWSTGAVVVTNVTTAQTVLSGWAIYNSTAAIRSAKIYNTTAPTAGSTVGLIVPVLIPGSTGGGGSNLSLTPYGVFTSNGLSLIVTANANATDTGAAGANDVCWTVFYI